MTYRLWLALVAGAFLAGLGLGGLVSFSGLPDGGTERAEARPTCRPSHPHLLAPAPTVLFWGNSLAFDRDWRLAGYRTVNCAQQGLTAARAAELTPALPEMGLTAIVLVFGTVELLRDIGDLEPFRQGLAAITDMLRQRHPGARIVALTIPEGEAWTYADHPLLGPLNRVLNTALNGLEGVEILDTTAALSALPAPRRSYDGAHLTAESYTVLEDALSALLDTPRR